MAKDKDISGNLGSMVSGSGGAKKEQTKVRPNFKRTTIVVHEDTPDWIELIAFKEKKSKTDVYHEALTDRINKFKKKTGINSLD